MPPAPPPAVATRHAKNPAPRAVTPRLPRPVIFDMADVPEGMPALAAQQAVLVVCSTQGDGVPPAEARGFCTWLAGLKHGDFDGVPFSVCALGDA